jgi:hypothetical protein
VAATSGSEDVDNSPAAYNQSIYLMVAVPYASFGVFGFLIYRGVRRNERYRRRLEGESEGLPPLNGQPTINQQQCR